MSVETQTAYAKLARWCRERNYAGDDPFDGLNSRLFGATPLARSRTARLAWTQLLKRSPINFRRLAMVKVGRNPKGTALFALAKLADLERTQSAEDADQARALLADLIGVQLKGLSGAAWGYNFDWQGRAFFAKQGTPTIVPTAFAVRALLAAAECWREPPYLSTARSVCDFILTDLNRTIDTDDELCFSYSPADRTQVYNASLLAGETLAAVSQVTGEAELCEFAVRAARYVVRQQKPDGSWAYGADDYQGWADNFHTAFILSSLSRIMKACPQAAKEFAPALKRGYEFWRDSFFLSDGWPQYFPDRLYPVDAHSAGAAIATFVERQDVDPAALDHAERIAHWAIRNLQSPRGYFYYQRHRFYTNRIPYMRWSQAWMAYALALLAKSKQ
ncbi:MAG: hypothetical protein ABIP75_13005 [Pyrinomonadaceae bacterium]